jgi:hypothetical protein
MIVRAIRSGDIDWMYAQRFWIGFNVGIDLGVDIWILTEPGRIIGRVRYPCGIFAGVLFGSFQAHIWPTPFSRPPAGSRGIKKQSCVLDFRFFSIRTPAC